MKKKIYILIIAFTTVLCLGIGALSYFNNKDNIDHELSQTINTSNNITINTINEFYKQISLYGDDYNISTDGDGNNDYNSSGDFNSQDEYVSSSKRVTLILNVDIKIHSNILISRDCHINLNGHYIDLAGYEMKIKHQFAGTMIIFNGDIKDSVTESVNNIIYDCPKGHLITRNVNLNNTDVTFVNVSTTSLLNSALNFIVANISNNNIYNMYTFVDQVEIQKSMNCTFTDSTHADCIGCIYTYTDLDLIYNYFNYSDLIIKYTSSDSSILTNDGRITKQNSNKDITLTITLEYNGVSIEKLVNVHVVVESSYAEASLMTLMNYLQKYYSSDVSKYVFGDAFVMPLKDTYFNTTYDFMLNSNTSNPIDINKTDYFDLTTYQGNAIVYLNSTIQNMDISATYTPENGDAITANMNTIPVQGDSNKLIDDNYSYALAIVQAEIGNQIIVTEEGTPSGYTEKLLKIDSSEFSKLDPNIDIKYKIMYNEADLTYEITTTKPEVSDYEYDYDDDIYDLFRVSAERNKDPYLNQGVYLSVTLTFIKESGQDKGEEITVLVPVIYEPKKNSNLFDPFDPYHVFFDSKFTDVTNNFSYHSFEIPLFYDNRFPTYTFIVYEEIKDNVTGLISYKLVESDLFTVTIKYTENGQQKTATIEDLSGLKTLLETCRIDSNSVTSISINPYLVDFETKTYKFVYLPIFVNDATGALQYRILNTTTLNEETGEKTFSYFNETTLSGAISRIDAIKVENYKYTSTLTIPGLVRCQSDKSYIEEAFLDPVFYEYIFKILHPEEKNNYKLGETFIYSSRLGNIIKTSNSAVVKKPVESDGEITYENYANVSNIVNISEITGLTSLKGIEYLSGINGLTFEGYNLTAMTEAAFTYTDVDGNVQSVAGTDWLAQIEYISKMNGLQYLNLSNTGIYDFVQGDYGFPEGDNNNFLATLSNSSSIKYLYLDNAKTTGYQNKIYSFTELSNFAALEYVNVKNNSFTVETGTDFFSNLIDLIFTTITNAIYGTQGATNQATFAILTTNGVIVDAGKPIEIDPKTQKIVDTLISLEYQDKLHTSLSIEEVYSYFVSQCESDGGISFFGISPQYTMSMGTTELRYTFDRIEFEPILDIVEGTTDTYETVYQCDSFNFHIIYTLEYRTYTQITGGLGWWGDWEIPENGSNIIDYHYTYKVSRYS